MVVLGKKLMGGPSSGSVTIIRRTPDDHAITSTRAHIPNYSKHLPSEHPTPSDAHWYLGPCSEYFGHNQRSQLGYHMVSRIYREVPCGTNGKFGNHRRKTYGDNWGYIMWSQLMYTL